MELEIKKLKNIPLLSDLQARFKNILVLDFETIPNGDTYHIGALFNDKTFQKKNIKNLKTALGELSEFSSGADYLLGHNIFNHDLRIANDASPEAEFLKLPVIDTLFLSPLAFPENPYHKLVKDYKLSKKSKNDPVADSIIALTLFEDQLIAFLTILEKEPDLISFFAFSFKFFCFNSKSHDLKGIHDLFHFLSRGIPAEEEAQNIFRSLCQGKICNNGLKQIWNRSLKNTFQGPVLAGPGSGKTKTIVHRCAWLIKAKSVDPSSILVLCFNHQAMLELKKRIKKLTGKSGDSVTSMTYHGFAMRLAGISLLDKYHESRVFNSLQNFDSIIDEAVDILNGNKATPGIEKSEARDYFLAGYRHILVDEYQDIDERQYRFISALTGRLEEDNEAKIFIMAVGDDDQSIYGFRDANIAFIKKFKEDYNAKTFYLVENYRSSYPIIEASGEFISLNKNRMKKSQTCRINSKRKSRKKPPEKIKKEALVQIICVKNIESQAAWVANEIKEMLHENQEITMDDFAVISRQGISYPYLVSVRMALAKKNIDFCYSIKGGAGFPMFRVREIQEFLEYLDGNKTRRIRPVCLKEEVLEKFNQNNIWTDQIEQILESWCQINSDIEISILEAKDFTLETLLEERREQKIGKGVFLGTVHGVKGMEFPYVFILDGGWKSRATEEERRLFYVGMTRGEKNLYLCRLETKNNPHVPVLMESGFIHKKRAEPSKIDGYTDDLTVSILGMEDLFISYPALFPENHEIDKNLSNLKTGDKVHLMEKKEKIYITNDKNRIIGSLSKKASLKWKGNTHKILNGKILGIIKRKQQDNEADEYKNIKKKSWELPMVEILHRRLKMEV